MRPEDPKIAELRQRRSRAVDRLNLVLELRRFHLFEDEVDLGHFEAGDGHVEIGDDLRQMLEFDGENLGVPAGPRGELVVRQDKGALLIGAEMLDADGRDLRHADEPGGGNPTVAGDDHAGFVDQNWIDEIERLQAVGDQFDLARGMSAGVARIGFEGFDRNHLDAIDRSYWAVAITISF